MKNDIYKHNLKKLTLETMFLIPRYTYVPNMATLSQTMPREWSYLGRLVWNLYMFIDDRPFCELFVWKVWWKSSLSFILSTNTHNRTPCQRTSRFDYFLTFFYFVQKGSKWSSCLFVQRGLIFQNYRWFCDITTTGIS